MMSCGKDLLAAKYNRNKINLYSGCFSHTKWPISVFLNKKKEQLIEMIWFSSP